MKSGNLLLLIAVALLIIAILSTGVLYLSVSNLNSSITGYLGRTTGEVNLTIETTSAINFTTSTINFGSGRTNSSAASLITLGSGTVVNGNWTAQSGLILENIGNQNLSLNITADNAAATFLGGTNPVFNINVSNSEVGSCINVTGNGQNLNIFHPVNTSIGNAQYCDVFRFESANDQIRIDFNLTLPEDSLTGLRGTQINATAFTALTGP